MDFSVYAHVRLEIENKQSADGFRIKVESKDKAHLGLLHGLSVATAHFDLFRAESIDVVTAKNEYSHRVRCAKKLRSFTVDHVDNYRMCSPVFVCNGSSIYSQKSARSLSVCSRCFLMKVYPFYGSWACNLAHAFDVCQGKAYFFC